MTRLNGCRMRLVLAGCVIGIMMGSGAAKADFTFGEPTNLGPTINSSAGDWTPEISANGLELYFGSDRGGNWDLWVSTRQDVGDQWGPPVRLAPPINSSYEDGAPQLSPDGLELYFYSKRSGGHGGIDIWLTRRTTLHEPWGPATNLGLPVNSEGHEGAATVTADGLSLFFSRSHAGAGGFDLWTTTRETRDDPWAAPVRFGTPINSSASEHFLDVSPDGLVLMFSNHAHGPFREGGYGGPDIWVMTRRTTEDEWGQPFNPGPPLNTSYAENGPSISSDGHWLYFNDWGPIRPGGHGNDDIWQAPILPVVDFTGDYEVGIDDLIVLIEHWGQNEPACDMAPSPLGDGVVDVADLEVLMSYYGQVLHDPHFIAHWELDETGGDVAYDSAGENDATVMGGAAWHPESGQINGALQLDGRDDYIQTPSMLNPKDDLFSVFVWIKGGVPGQAILSQEEGVGWLLTDAQGRLMTELISSGRRPGDPLFSETIVTDGNWHRVGLVWDSEYRSLYVDDELVATDVVPQNAFPSSRGGLIIGAGKDRETDTFWSGMIDGVRIYDRVLEP